MELGLGLVIGIDDIALILFCTGGDSNELVNDDATVREPGANEGEEDSIDDSGARLLATEELIKEL